MLHCTPLNPSLYNILKILLNSLIINKNLTGADVAVLYSYKLQCTYNFWCWFFPWLNIVHLHGVVHQRGIVHQRGVVF